MRKTCRKSQAFSFLLLGVLLLGITYISSSTASAAIITVPGDFATIQEAIDDPGTMNGDIINVLAGIYNESNILVTKELFISGAGLGATVIDPNGFESVFRITANNVLIRDLTIQNARQAIRVANKSQTLDNITIRRVAMLNSKRGIEVGNASTATNLLVDECTFENNRHGFRINSRAHLDGARIQDSNFTDNDIGIYVLNGGNTSTMSNVRIRGNTFSDHTFSRGAAIYLEEAQDTRITGNLFMNNLNDVVISKLYQPGIPVSDIRITRNTIMGTTGVVFSLFNADNGGQTVFNGVLFAINDITTSGTAILASAHRTGAGAGGTGWNTVRVKRNCITGIGAGNAVRFFVPAGVVPNQALGGAILNSINNFWGVGTLPGVTALMEIPAITNFEPFHTSCEI